MDIPFVTFENMHKEIKEEALEKAALFKPCTVAFDSISSTFNVIWPLFLPSDMLIFRGGLANKTNDLSESFHL